MASRITVENGNGSGNHPMRVNQNGSINANFLVDGEFVSKDNPSHTTPTDHSGRVGLMSVFGEQLIGQRIAQVSGQFKYGLPTDASKPSIVSTGSINIVEALLVVSTGTAPDGAASIANKRSIRYIPGYDTFCQWTSLFTGTFNESTGNTKGIANSQQRAGLYDDNDGFFIGFNGETFGFTRRRLGVDTFTSIDLESFKEREGYGLDLTKGNIFRLNYGYLGFAPIRFEVLNPQGVGVVIEAKHLCMQSRGIEKQHSDMITSCMLGVFRENPETRQEFLRLITKRGTK